MLFGSKKNKILIILFSALFLVSIAFAQSELQIDYPKVPGKTDIFKTGRTPLLPQYIAYAINAAIAISGAVIFFIIIMAGFKYFMSRGSGSKVQDAKDSIFAAFLGLIILLCSYLLLNFISPNYTTLNLSLKTVGIIIQNAGGEEMLVSSGQENLENFIPIKIIISKKYINESEMTLYSEKNYSGSIYKIRKSSWICPNEDECYVDYPENYRKGSISVLILRPGIFIFKDKKVPYYVGNDLPNTMALLDLINAPGVVNGIRIYNSSSTNYGAMTFIENNYIGPGAIYFPEKKAGWASEEIIDLNRIYSIKIFNVRQINGSLGEYFYKPEYDYTSKCKTSDDPIQSLPTQKISCGIEEYVYSMKLNNSWAILISYGNKDNPDRFAKFNEYSSQIPKIDRLTPFAFGEMIKVSDPNMDDNPEIGQCICNGRWLGIFWCVNWQSCATHSIIFTR